MYSAIRFISFAQCWWWSLFKGSIARMQLDAPNKRQIQWKFSSVTIIFTNTMNSRCYACTCVPICVLLFAVESNWSCKTQQTSSKIKSIFWYFYYIDFIQWVQKVMQLSVLLLNEEQPSILYIQLSTLG